MLCSLRGNWCLAIHLVYGAPARICTMHNSFKKDNLKYDFRTSWGKTIDSNYREVHKTLGIKSQCWAGFWLKFWPISRNRARSRDGNSTSFKCTSLSVSWFSQLHILVIIHSVFPIVACLYVFFLVCYFLHWFQSLYLLSFSGHCWNWGLF